MERTELVTSCGLNGCSTAPIPYTGPDQATVAVLMERPDIGESAMVTFRNQLTRAGFDWAQIAFTSVVACTSKQPRPPEKDEVAACTENRKKQLWFIKPRFVLLAGNVPLQVYRPDLQVSRVHGRAFQVAYGDDKPIFFPIFHPAAVERNDAWRELVDMDLRVFARIVHDDGHWTTHTPDTCIECGLDCVAAGHIRFDSMGFTYCADCIKGAK